MSDVKPFSDICVINYTSWKVLASNLLSIGAAELAIWATVYRFPALFDLDRVDAVELFKWRKFMGSGYWDFEF